MVRSSRVSRGFARAWPAAAVALGYRLVLDHSLRGHPDLQLLGLDSRFYHEWGSRLAAGGGDLAGPYFMGPLYPHLLGLTHAALGPSAAHARLTQAALGAMACSLAFTVGRRAFGVTAGAVAGLLLALYGYGTFLETQLATEPLLLCVVLALCATLIAAGCLVVIAPVTLHNLRAGGGFVPLTTNGGINYYIGNNDLATGAFVAPAGIEFFQPGADQDGGSRALAERTAGRALTPAQASRFWLERGLRWNLAYPARTLALVLRKLVLFWSDYETPQLENFDQARTESALLGANPVRFGWVAALGLCGIVVAWSNRHARLLAGLLAACLLSVLPFFITARYRLPCFGLLALLAGAGVTRIVELARARRRARAALPAAAAALLAVALNLYMPAGVQASARMMPFYNQGVVHMQRGEYQAAASSFQQALVLRANHLESLANLGWCLLQLGRADEARESFTHAAALRPDDPRVLRLLAEAELGLGHDAQAEAVLQHLVGLDARDAWALAQLGDLALRRGDGTRARALWERALQTGDPGMADALRQRLGQAPARP